MAGSAAGSWRVALVAYCYLASVAPVWVLLQPRDYLSSFLLFACLGGGLIGLAAGVFVGGGAPSIAYPAFLGFHASGLGAMGALFPALFITVACGACSGFHSVVASGTTARQLDRESHARAVGYGSMLLEGLLALVAVATVAVLSSGSPEAKLPPPLLFASGLARFLETLGLPHGIGQSFAMLALSTFLLTTLDTCTRLARYSLSELLSLRDPRSQRVATLVTLAVPLTLTLIPFHDAQGHLVPAWKMIWPVFGATNQLLGGFALLVLTLWLRHEGRPIWATFLPMVFMIGATLTALVQLVATYGLSLVGAIAAMLLALAMVLLWEAARSLRRNAPSGQARPPAAPPQRPAHALDS